MALQNTRRAPPATPPPGAVDTHVHVFDPVRFPMVAARSYTPGPASLEDLQVQHARLGISCAVLVQPSVYGNDNRCLLDALHRGGPDRCRGIAVLDLGEATDAQLQDLHAQGVRGVRLNLEVRHEVDPAQVRAQLAQAAAAVTQAGWCVQLHVGSAALPVVEQMASHFAVPLVLDHFGGLQAGDLSRQPERVQCLQRLLATGRAYVKVSAFYRASSQVPLHADLAPLVQQLVQARSDRLLWGSDWPHTGGGGAPRDPSRVEPFRPVDLVASLGALRAWLPDDQVWWQLLVDNPANLYGFKAAA